MTMIMEKQMQTLWLDKTKMEVRFNADHTEKGL